MTDYLHHVPGRLRVRSKALRCDSAARSAALRGLRALDGVRTVRLNAKAASVTVCYDVDATSPQLILDFIHAECRRSRSEEGTQVMAKSSKPQGSFTAEIGRMALSVLVSKGVSYSISSLLGARV